MNTQWLTTCVHELALAWFEFCLFVICSLKAIKHYTAFQQTATFFFLNSRFLSHLLNQRDVQRVWSVVFLSLRYKFLSYAYKFLWKRDHTYGFWLSFPYCKCTHISLTRKKKSEYCIHKHKITYRQQTEQIQKS